MKIVSPIVEYLENNPAFIRSTRARMRGLRTFVLPVGYALILCCIMYFTLSVVISIQNTPNYSGIGRQAFVVLTVLQSIFLTLICPTLTAGIITSEKEKQTYDMLVTTPMHPRMIVWGELISAVLFSILVMSSSLPLVGLCMVLGGVSPWEVTRVYGNFLVLAVLYTSFGLLVSTGQKKTSSAMGAAVGSLIFLVYPLTTTLQTLIMGSPAGVGVWAALTPFFTIVEATSQKPVSYLSYGMIKIPYWIISYIFTLLLSGLFLAIAARKFYSSRNRALSAKQFTVLYSLVLGYLFLVLWKVPYDDFVWYMINTSGVLLLIGVLNFVPEHPHTIDYLITPDDMAIFAREKDRYQIHLLPILAIGTYLIGMIYHLLTHAMTEISIWTAAFLVIFSAILFTISLSQFLHRFVMSRRNIIAMVGIILLLGAAILPLMGLAIISNSSEPGIWMNSMILFSPSYGLLSAIGPKGATYTRFMSIIDTNPQFPLWVKVCCAYFALGLVFAVGTLLKKPVIIQTQATHEVSAG